MRRIVAVLTNPEKPKAKKAFVPLARWLKKNKVRIISSLNHHDLPEAEFAVVLGGDGTILHVAKSLAPLGVPVLGVNLGQLGFLAETNLKNLYSVVRKALQSQLRVEERLMLDVIISRKKGKNMICLPAFNDCYLHGGSDNRVIKIEADLNGEYLTTYNGDGLIVSTPTGSTAYSLAASGPIVSPGLPVVLLTPICPHTLAQRPLLVSCGDRVELRTIESDSDSFTLLSLDGQKNLRIYPGDHITVEAASSKVKLLQHPSRSYYQILRAKLGWGER